MSADELQTALEKLRTARDLADGEAEERVSTVVERVESALDAGRTIDHGNLARMDRTLAEVQQDADDETDAAVQEARDALATYREGVPGA
jgi:vacuolar-type H+-ATPase subunit E/Vma4